MTTSSRFPPEPWSCHHHHHHPPPPISPPPSPPYSPPPSLFVTPQPSSSPLFRTLHSERKDAGVFPVFVSRSRQRRVSVTSLLFQNGGREYIIAQDIFLFLLLLLLFFFFFFFFFSFFLFFFFFLVVMIALSSAFQIQTDWISDLETRSYFRVDPLSRRKIMLLLLCSFPLVGVLVLVGGRGAWGGVGWGWGDTGREGRISSKGRSGKVSLP